MNTPTPLPPLSPLTQAPKGKSNVRIAVVTIIALHAVFFGGLLLQGCKKKPDETSGLSSAQGTTNLQNANLGSLSNPAYANPTNEGSTETALGGPATTSNTLAGGTMPTNFTGPNDFLSGVTNPPVTASQTIPGVTPGGETLGANEGAPATTTQYTVKRGDYPAKIARHFKISLSALMKANPGLQPRHMMPNQKINIPAPTRTASQAEAAQLPPGMHLYQVKRGDNLSRIARHFNVKVKAIREANNLHSDRIMAGQKLKIPAPGGGSSAAGGNPGAPTGR